MAKRVSKIKTNQTYLIRISNLRLILFRNLVFFKLILLAKPILLHHNKVLYFQTCFLKLSSKIIPFQSVKKTGPKKAIYWVNQTKILYSDKNRQKEKHRVSIVNYLHQVVRQVCLAIKN